MNIGWPEILVILLIILLLFGAKRLPDLMRSVGKSLREFKKGRDETETDVPEQKDEQKREEDKK